MKTKELIISMLKENTGTALCDSGGVYGRHWQVNQSIDFDKTEEVTIDEEWLKDGDEIIPTVNLYHFLTLNLTSDEITEEFNSLFNVMDNWQGYGYGLSENACLWISNMFNLRIAELSDKWHNSYNGESLLSQVIQFRYINDDYVLLQIHNGCDVRGGYTDAKLFKLRGCGLYDGVYGSVEYSNGEAIDVDTMTNGYCLTTEDGDKVLYKKGMKFNLYLIEW